MNQNNKKIMRMFVEESNLIEGIVDTIDEEVWASVAFVDLDAVTIRDLENLVSAYQPGKRLRKSIGQNVWVGGKQCPLGGPDIPIRLQTLLDHVNSDEIELWDAHVRYEMLHPFEDGNGRSGRMLWLWMWYERNRAVPPSFLHMFYYQTLRRASREDGSGA